MPRPKSADRVTALERQQTEIAAALKKARADAARLKREEDDRRCRLFGAALLAKLPADEARELVRRVVPGTVKGKADLSLFAAWL